MEQESQYASGMQRVNRLASQQVSVLVVVLGIFLFGASGYGQKRPMTFEDLQAIKRISDPQVSPSGKWVMFSVTEVDLAANKKTTHLWTVSIDGKTEEKKVTDGKTGESNGRFSPDGKQILFVSSNDGSSQIWLAPWNDEKGTVGKAHRFTDVSTEADGAIWAPDGKSIAFVSDVYPECDETAFDDACNKAKDEAAAKNPVKAMVFDHLLYRHWDHYLGAKRTHILLVDTNDAKKVRDLTPTRDIGDHVAPTFSLGGSIGYAFSPDSKEFAYVVNLDKDPSSSTNNDIYTLQLGDANARPVKVTTSPGSDDAPAYSPDGKWLAFRSQVRNGYESDRFRLMLYDRAAKIMKDLLPKFDRWVDEIAWASNSDRIYFTTGTGRGEAILSIRTRGDDGRIIAGVGNAADWEVWEEAKRKQRENPKAEVFVPMHYIFGGEFGSIQVSNDHLIASFMSVNTPSTLLSFEGLISVNVGAWSISLDGSAQGNPKNFEGRDGFVQASAYGPEITHINDALLTNLDAQAMDGFWFPSTDGTKIQGFIIRPPNFDPAKKYPLKFLIHGGPQGAWGDGWSYRWNPELFAANGYVVVMINPRGSTGYGQKFVEAVSGDWGGKPYQDLMAGLDYAEKKFPFIDKERECALGASYGGYMANWILTHTNRFACIVTHDGMYNPQSAYGSTEEMWFNEWEFRRQIKDAKGNAHPDTAPAQPWKYAKLPASEDPFRKWSPMLNIDKAKTPTLIIHSQKDYRLDVSEGFQLFTALQRLGVPSKMLYFPDEGHWVLKPQNSKLWYETVNEWCDKWTHTNKYADVK